MQIIYRLAGGDETNLRMNDMESNVRTGHIPPTPNQFLRQWQVHRALACESSRGFGRISLGTCGPWCFTANLSRPSGTLLCGLWKEKFVICSKLTNFDGSNFYWL